MQVNLLPPDVRDGERTLIDELIADQRSLTAVDRFSQKHDLQEFPTQAKYYRDLIPLTQPGPGEQYAFEVKLDQCSGCKACVTACHSLNGLDDDETWRDTGLLHGGTFKAPVQQHVTTACHHCVDPGCLNGCPVLAYDKDPVTGIVRHLDDQCIGCQYCVMKCPYEVPKYSARRGIVRKCDMCSNRLTAGEAPACVQACPTEAIRITIVNRDGLIAQHRGTTENHFLPASPNPAITVPTTRYTNTRTLPANVRSGDAEQLDPQPGHLPLVFMLVLTQLSVGAFAVDFVLGLLAPSALVHAARPTLAMIGALAGLAGIAVSVAHLGRPLGAWRAFLGLRKSWLSREIVTFGLFMPLALAYTASVRAWLPLPADVQKLLLAGTVASGLIGVFCSVMIYHDTQRDYWSWTRGGIKFFGSALLLGLGAATTGLAITLLPAPGMIALAETPLLRLLGVLFAGTMGKLAFESSLSRVFDMPEPSSLQRSARLLDGPLRTMAATRTTLGIIGGILLPALFLMELPFKPDATPAAGFLIASSVVTFGLLLIGELLERYLFFRAVAPVKMPGGIAA